MSFAAVDAGILEAQMVTQIDGGRVHISPP
jgi:hypothetical protein